MISKLFKKYYLIKSHIGAISSKFFYGFVNGHSHLNSDELALIDYIFRNPSQNTVSDFECEISKIIGVRAGQVISFASGRMAFYALLKAFGVGQGDEVILTGSTCAVMATAVMRTGAIPIYADIDPKTYGSSLKEISLCISNKTKAIVAQHSFGIPCDIDEIESFAKKNNIYLIEDCALALGSELYGKRVGTFGDAAFFSFDRTKTINSIIGGVAYSPSVKISSAVRDIQQKCEELPYEKLSALYQRFNLERIFCTPKRYKWMGLIDLILWVKVSKFDFQSPFLDGDFKVANHNDYPYPSRMPPFIAQICLLEIARWDRSISLYKSNLSIFKREMSSMGCASLIPEIYNDERRVINPLRIVWHCSGNSELRRQAKDFLDINSIWFQRPLVATVDPIQSYGYILGSCPIAESVGTQMMNVPSNLPEEDFRNLSTLLIKEINGIPKYIPQ